MLYNPPWVHYAYNRMLRRQGAVEAERHGAVAALLRSVSPYSLSTPHTGATDPASIPFAAITHEDADLLARLAGRGHNVVVKLYMEAQLREPAVSRNIIAELPGTERPDELVVMGGHIDSWDVGAGVLDDAGGAFIAWEALRLMRKYDIRPRRTVRVVFWTVIRGGTLCHALAVSALTLDWVERVGFARGRTKRLAPQARTCTAPTGSTSCAAPRSPSRPTLASFRTPDAST